MPAVPDGSVVVVILSAGLMVKGSGVDVPADVLTVTLAVPAVAIRLAGTAAVSCVALT